MTAVARRTVLGSLLVLAMALRVAGIGFDLPFVYHPDEPFNVAIVQSIFKVGDFNPHYFVYPTLFYYVNAIAYVPYYIAGSVLGLFHARQDIGGLIELGMGVTKATQPSVVLLSRLVSATASTAAVALTFVVGMRLFRSVAVATLAALMMAIVPTSVSIARYVTPDSCVLFFTSASLLAAVLVYREGRLQHYVAAGLLVGLAASTKYNAALLVLLPIAAHFLREGNRGLRDRNLYVAALCCCVGFVAGTPYAALDARNFIDYLRIDGRHYARGHPGMEGYPFRWYVGYMASTAAVPYALALLEMSRGCLVRSRPLMLLSVFPIGYFLFIISFEVRNDRTFLPLTPFLFLLAASFLVHAWTFVRQSTDGACRIALASLLVVLAGAGLVQAGANTYTETAKLMHPDGREVSRQWIAANVPRGSRIAFESYSPYVDPAHYPTLSMPRIIDHDPDWYAENGFRYLVLSAGLYGRYFREPARYPSDVAKYERFFARFRLLRRFDDGGYEIRIYEVAPPPARLSRP